MKTRYFAFVMIVIFVVFLAVRTLTQYEKERQNADAQIMQQTKTVGQGQQLTKQTAQPTTQTSINKYCTADDDCGLLVCSGCFSKDFLKTAPSDLPCMAYQGRSCVCVSGQCAVK